MGKRTVDGHQRLFDLLRTLRAGHLLSPERILEVTDWSKSTLTTYRSKNKLGAVLVYERKEKQFRVVKDGEELTFNEFSSAFTQVNSEGFVPTKGISLSGQIRAYALLEKLGAGAVAEVWKCFYGSSESRQYAAAKIMVPSADLLIQGKVEDIKERFVREAVNGQRLSHNHVIRVVDHGRSNDSSATPFLILELAQGSIRGRLEEEEIFSIEESAAIVEACSAGLEYLHGAGCVHRDVKPDNILVVGGSTVLGDLGIVSWDDLNPAFTRAGTMTRNSMILGSYYYMAPEQAKRGGRAVPPSDVYALGVTWLELLLGDAPHPSEIGFGEYPQPTKNDEINRFISSMLRFSPGDRPTPGQVAQFARKIQ